ncbi:MAG: HIT family protein [Nanoarchaeota archaeon]
MLYNKYLKKLKKCPFCNVDKSHILLSNKNAFVLLCRSPYTKDHLLVIPKKHVKFLNKLNTNEQDDLNKLMIKALNKLHKKHKNVSILYKEGVNKDVGKTINHAHIHLIPRIKISIQDINWKKREVMCDKEYNKKTIEMKKILK